MNKQNLPAIPDENKIEELLRKIQPLPSERFYKKMKQAVWRVDGRQQTALKNLRLKITFAIVLLAALGALLTTPQGQAWAQEVVRFFEQVNFTTIPASKKEVEQYNYITTSKESYELPLVPVIIPTVAPEMASLPGCDNSEKAQSYTCQIAYAESQLGFDLMELPAIPVGLEFQAVWFDKLTKSATISYESSGTDLRLTERRGSPPEQMGGHWSLVPVGEVEQIKVGSFDGEYVSGFFDLQTGNYEYVWKDTSLAQRVAWSDGTNWYLLESGGAMQHDQLITLAESLVTTPDIVEKQPDHNALDAKLASLSEAEAYSGLDLKAPTLLPIGFTFSYAHYSWLHKNEVYLRYDGSNTGSNGYLLIYETKDNSTDFDSLLTSHGNYEIVKVNGRNAFYSSAGEESLPYLSLSWRDGDLNYGMLFYWYADTIHGVLNKEKMIAIAESIDNINVFKSRMPRSYEDIKIYEQALGIAIHRFPKVPAGWSFNHFWFDIWEKCIGLIYTSNTHQGQLFLTQCGTDRFFEVSDVPATVIERVKVGKNKAQYFTGGSAYDNNGISVWNSDLPVKALRWQEDGLWIQITLYENKATLSDKEDLISIAESLH